MVVNDTLECTGRSHNEEGGGGGYGVYIYHPVGTVTAHTVGQAAMNIIMDDNTRTKGTSTFTLCQDHSHPALVMN